MKSKIFSHYHYYKEVLDAYTYHYTMNQLTITQTLIPDTEWDIN